MNKCLVFCFGETNIEQLIFKVWSVYCIGCMENGQDGFRLAACTVYPVQCVQYPVSKQYNTHYLQYNGVRLSLVNVSPPHLRHNCKLQQIYLFLLSLYFSQSFSVTSLHYIYLSIYLYHCHLKVSSSESKIDQSFANKFFKTKAFNKCFIVLKCTCKGLQKSISELEQ